MLPTCLSSLSAPIRRQSCYHLHHHRLFTRLAQPPASDHAGRPAQRPAAHGARPARAPCLARLGPRSSHTETENIGPPRGPGRFLILCRGGWARCTRRCRGRSRARQRRRSTATTAPRQAPPPPPSSHVYLHGAAAGDSDSDSDRAQSRRRHRLEKRIKKLHKIRIWRFTLQMSLPFQGNSIKSKSTDAAMSKATQSNRPRQSRQTQSQQSQSQQH